MNHQITLEELGLIPSLQKKTSATMQKKTSATIIPCYDCICNHCANCVECADNCTGEMDEPCFVCEDCKIMTARERICGGVSVTGIRLQTYMQRKEKEI